MKSRHNTEQKEGNILINFHDHDNNVLGNIKLVAGDDALNVQWMDI